MLSAEPKNYLTIEMKETYGKTVSIMTEANLDIYPMLEQMVRLLSAYGYSQKDIKEAIIARGEEFMMEEDYEREKSQTA